MKHTAQASAAAAASRIGIRSADIEDARTGTGDTGRRVAIIGDAGGPHTAGTDTTNGLSGKRPASGYGVLLVNTGTPDAPTATAVRHFLRRFLSDPRVIELPRLLWLPLLYGLVLPLRSPRSARKYHEIWLEEGSPLFVHMQRLRAALQAQLTGPQQDVRVETAFLYSLPTVEQALTRLRDAGATDIAVLPVFPQASGTTQGAVFDQVGQVLRRWRAYPDLRLLSGYHADPAYIGALAAHLTDHWRRHGRNDHLLMSFHGIPSACVDRGDRYADECRGTATRLAEAVGLAPEQWTLSFQSRFGANRWLGPATVQCLVELPRRGVRSLDVMCPGFAVDCLETLEEIAITGRQTFLAGGERFSYVPALNGSEAHALALAAILRRDSRIAGVPQ